MVWQRQNASQHEIEMSLGDKLILAILQEKCVFAVALRLGLIHFKAASKNGGFHA